MAEAHCGKKKREEIATDDTKCFDDKIIPYSEQEADNLALKLANKKSFTEAKKILNVWFKRDICKQNFIKLISLNLCCFHNMVKWRNEELNAAKNLENGEETLKDDYYDIQSDIERIEDVIKAFENPNIFGNSSIQKKKVEVVKKNFLDLKEMFLLQNSGSVLEKVESSNSTEVSESSNLTKVSESSNTTTVAESSDSTVVSESSDSTKVSDETDVSILSKMTEELRLD